MATIHRANVQTGLRRMAEINGEVWFKFDRASGKERQRINHTSMSLKKIQEHLRIATAHCPTWLQTCVFQIDMPTEAEDQVT